MELSPGDEGALFNLAVLYANHNMEEEARGALQQLLQVLPCFAIAAILRLLTHLCEGEPQSRGRASDALAIFFLSSVNVSEPLLSLSHL